MTNKVQVRALSHFTDTVHGNMTRRTTRWVDPVTADRWESLGVVEIVADPRNPVSPSTDPADAGSGSPAASSPGGQASQESSAITPEPESGEQSSSTTPGSLPRGQTPSTPVTPDGGSTTATQSQKGSQAKGGHKTTAKRR